MKPWRVGHRPIRRLTRFVERVSGAARSTVRRLDPSRYVKFKSPLHNQHSAAVLGISLGISFFTCFITGMVSHVIQHPPSWYAWPARPAGFYRVTQGLHVATGLVSIPLLFAKLWTVFPKLFDWPPATSMAQFLERASLPPLIGGAFLQLLTGLANINQWYFFHFFFTSTHYAVAWITIGALIVHIGAKGTITRMQLTRHQPADAYDADSKFRRNFLLGVFGTTAVVSLFTVGQSVSPLGKLALLSPRRPGVGPQKLPVNRSALAAGVIDGAHSSDYRLTVEGRVDRKLEFTLEDLQSLPQHSAALPIACVEGWSQTAHWSGVRVRDLVAMAGGPENASVLVESLEKGSTYGQSVLNRHHANDRDTLLAIELDGEPLHIDHGYPCRLIGPNRPGVFQTKWVHRLVVV